jgi:glutamate racemase
MGRASEGIDLGTEAERLVTSAIGPALQAGADRIVLACTHFSFLSHLIAEKSGIPVIDPAVAVAAQVARVCPNPDGEGRLTLAVSSDGGEFALLARALAGLTAPVIPFEP